MPCSLCRWKCHDVAWHDSYPPSTLAKEWYSYLHTDCSIRLQETHLFMKHIRDLNRYSEKRSKTERSTTTSAALWTNEVSEKQWKLLKPLIFQMTTSACRWSGSVKVAITLILQEFERFLYFFKIPFVGNGNYWSEDTLLLECTVEGKKKKKHYYT